MLQFLRLLPPPWCALRRSSLTTRYLLKLTGHLSAPASRKVVDSFPVLEDYARRIHHRYFPDYALWE
jgi:hypothetical protein